MHVHQGIGPALHGGGIQQGKVGFDRSRQWVRRRQLPPLSHPAREFRGLTQCVGVAAFVGEEPEMAGCARRRVAIRDAGRIPGGGRDVEYFVFPPGHQQQRTGGESGAQVRVIDAVTQAAGHEGFRTGGVGGIEHEPALGSKAARRPDDRDAIIEQRGEDRGIAATGDARGRHAMAAFDVGPAQQVIHAAQRVAHEVAARSVTRQVTADAVGKVVVARLLFPGHARRIIGEGGETGAREVLAGQLVRRAGFGGMSDRDDHRRVGWRQVGGEKHGRVHLPAGVGFEQDVFVTITRSLAAADHAGLQRPGGELGGEIAVVAGEAGAHPRRIGRPALRTGLQAGVSAGDEVTAQHFMRFGEGGGHVESHGLR